MSIKTFCDKCTKDITAGPIYHLTVQVIEGSADMAIEADVCTDCRQKAVTWLSNKIAPTP